MEKATRLRPYYFWIAFALALWQPPALILLSFTELAFSESECYVDFLQGAAIVYLLLLFWIWRSKKWAALAYMILAIVVETVLYHKNWLWHWRYLLAPAISSIVFLVYTGRDKRTVPTGSTIP